MQQLTLPAMQQPARLKIMRDDHPENPREWGSASVMACWHNRYNLGDEQPKCDAQEYLLALADEAVPGTAQRWEKWVDAYPHPWNAQAWKDYDYDRTKHWNKTVQKVLDKHVIMLDLYLYDHSGITMRTNSFSCPWDSGAVGFIYMTRAQITKEYGWKVLTAKRRAQIVRRLEDEVQVYDDYLTGQVYGFDIEVWDGEDWVAADSCWGFYGDEAYKQIHSDSASSYGFTLAQCRDAQYELDTWVTVGADALPEQE